MRMLSASSVVSGVFHCTCIESAYSDIVWKHMATTIHEFSARTTRRYLHLEKPRSLLELHADHVSSQGLVATLQRSRRLDTPSRDLASCAAVVRDGVANKVWATPTPQRVIYTLLNDGSQAV